MSLGKKATVVVPVSTIQVVRKCITKLNPPTAHTVRYSQVLGRCLPSGFEPERQKTLTEAGFCWMVVENFASRFQYCAEVKNPSTFGDPMVVEDGKSVVYVGDIPDFALDRIMAAEQVGLKYFTIHSNSPLPVRYMTICDPVLVGWTSRPYFGRSRVGWESQHAWAGGVVIAVWDNDRELEI